MIIGGSKKIQRDLSLLYRAAHLQLRQIARKLLGTSFESDGDTPKDAEHELFDGLQKRYPISRQEGEEPTYRLLEELTHEDRQFNIRRLRREGNKKLADADALQALDDQIEKKIA